VARRVTRASRGIRLPKVQEPVLPPPSVRDQVLGMLPWPEGIQMDPGIVVPPAGTMDVREIEPGLRPDPSTLPVQPIAARRNARGRKGRR